MSVSPLVLRGLRPPAARYYPDALTVREVKVMRWVIGQMLGDSPMGDAPNRSELRTLQVKLRHAERMEDTE